MKDVEAEYGLHQISIILESEHAQTATVLCNRISTTITFTREAVSRKR